MVRTADSIRKSVNALAEREPAFARRPNNNEVAVQASSRVAT